MSEELKANENGSRRLLFSDLSRLGILIVLSVGFLLFFHDPHVREHIFHIDEARASLQAEQTLTAGLFSRLTFIFTATALVAIGLPRLYVSAIAGLIYGATEGIMLGLIASVLGASITYVLGRTLLGDVARRRLRGRVALWQERFQANAFWWVLQMRLIPFANSTVMNLLCGTCRVPFRPFLTASALGFIPLTVVFALVGSGGAKRDFLQIGLAVVLLLLSFLIERMVKHWRRSTDVSPTSDQSDFNPSPGS